MKDKSSRLLQLETFVNEKLRNDLKLTLEGQEKLCSQIAEYLQVKETIEKVMHARRCRVTSDTPKFNLNTRVDLGCNFYSNAVVHDPSTIFVELGYGLFLEMTFDEALKFVDKKVELLNESVDEFTRKSCDIKAQIKFVLEGIRELQGINFTENTEKNNLYI
jgi:prefoldin subunit 5